MPFSRFTILDPNDYQEELVDHINISSTSQSLIGKLLVPEYSKMFAYPYLGKFLSVYALWVWLRDQDSNDILRKLTYHKLKDYLHQSNSRYKYVKNFKAIIAYATWLKFTSVRVKALVKEIPDTNVFLSYEVIHSTGLRVQLRYPTWLIDIADEIVRAIKSDTEPNFMFLTTHPGEANHYYIDGILKSYFPNVFNNILETELDSVHTTT